MTAAGRRRLRSRWHNFWTFVAMLLGLGDGLCFSAILTEGITSAAWRLTLTTAGALVSTGAFGLLAVRAVRIGLYADTAGVLAARSLTITYTVSLDEVSKVVLYHGHSSHGGRFWAPAIHVRSADGRERVIRLWWLAAAGEDIGERWTSRVIQFVKDAQDAPAHRAGPDSPSDA